MLQEENEDFVQNISIAIENILDGVYSFFSKELETTRNVTAEWNAEAEKLFSLLDEDRKGHLEAEAIQFWVLTLLAPEVGCIEPILFRKQTSAFLQEMQHSNGLVTMRGWKNYLLNKHWNESLTLKLMSENFEKTIGVWKDIRVRVFNSESLANYNYLRSSEEKLPSIWNQCILSCVFLSGTRTDNEKLAKYLRFIGLQLGSTASLSTKGVVYIKGTHIHDISEFSIYIMANFLQFSGQYNTSASISTLTQQALDTLSTDPRFKSIRKALQTYDNLLNIVMYELISSFPKGPREIPVPSKSSMKLKYSSTTSVLNSSARSTTPNNSESTRKIASSKFTAKDVQSMKKLRESKDLPKRTRSPLLQTPQKKNSFVDIRKKELEKSATLASTKGDFPREKTNFTRHSKSPVRLKPNFKETNRSKSPIRDNSKSPARKSTKESYEEVMKRLKSK